LLKLFASIKSSIIKHPYLLIILLIGVGLRFYHLTFQSVWDDELSTLVEANPDLKFEVAVETYLQFDNIPPLYPFILRYVFTIFGYSALLLRLFSALLGVASIIAIYFLGRTLYNKTSGYIASLLLALNYFQIYYSQEGRPYTFLTLFTILSFYRLLIYLKHNSFKNAILYAFFSLGMIYSQYIAFFTLAAQGLIILIFFIFFQKDKKLLYLLHFGIAFILITIGYLPAYSQMINNLSIQSSWIPFPSPDVFTGYFRDFFGNSELIVTLIYIFIIFFFVQCLTENFKTNPILNQSGNFPFAFLILVTWISVYLLIPLIRTYTTIPILVPRYFNPIIPGICIMAAIGVAEIKSKVIQITLIVLFVCFSIVDLFVIKKYYTTHTKPQYSENAYFVLQNLKPSEPIITNFCWHYQYFFNPINATSQIQCGNLNKYIGVLQKETSLPSSFWYLGEHEKKFNLTADNDLFLSNNYLIDSRIELFEVNASHFVLKNKTQISLDFNRFTPIKQTENNQLFLDGSANIIYDSLVLQKGFYNLLICAKSLPEVPLNKVQGHLSLKINNQIVGGTFVKESKFFSTQKISFVQKIGEPIKIELLFDNDMYYKKVDRNILIASISLEKL
jgi:hypothetical protein